MNQFTPRTLGCLQSAGWVENRRIDVTQVIEELKEDGFLAPASVAEFLARFGDLRLSFPHSRVPTAIDNCHFDAIRAADGVFPERLKDWEDRIGKRLTPIGEANREYMVLLMDSAGNVYMAMDDLFFRYADSGEEAINALCMGYAPEGNGSRRLVPSRACLGTSF